MKAPAFELPEDVEVASLLVERQNETTLKPDSPVICINRGRVAREVTFNGEHLVVPPGLFKTEYRAALHFKDRLVVPGTRNLEVGGHVSWISILGSEDQRLRVDPAETCEPFTDEELQHFGESLEAIDRSSVIGAGRFVTPVRTQAARASSRTQGAAMRPAIDADMQASEAASEAAAHVMERPPVEELATRQAEQSFAAETGMASAAASDGPAPSPRPMRGQRAR